MAKGRKIQKQVQCESESDGLKPVYPCPLGPNRNRWSKIAYPWRFLAEKLYDTPYREFYRKLGPAESDSILTLSLAIAAVRSPSKRR